MPPFSSTWDRPGSDASAFLRALPVRVRLRDRRSLEGRIHVADGQSLVEFLGLRRAFLNLTHVRWLDGRGGEEPLSHLGVRLSQVAWVQPLDASLALSSAVAPTEASRSVELGLAGDLLLRAPLQIADEQRMSDYFEAHSSFIPLRSVRLAGTGEELERVAVHGTAILTIREV